MMGLPSSSRLISLLVASLMVSFALSSHSSSSSTPKLSEDDASYTLPLPADFLVQNLDKVVKAFEKFPGRMYAGSLPMDHKSTTVLGANPNGERTGNLNFWLFVPNKIKAENTISAWFNGGPGCSSFSAGVLFENAPITLPLEPAGWCCEEEDTPLTYNKYGWTVATVMLYVEQPIGKGCMFDLNIALF
jgi:carboxypeptidase D